MFTKQRQQGIVFTACILILCSSPVAAQTWIELSPLAPAGSPPVFGPNPVNYDAANNRLIVFVPGVPASGGPGNQVWVLTNANGLGGPPVWIPLLPSGSPPFSNTGESVVYDAPTNHLTVYGGCAFNCSPALHEVFVLSNANGLGGPPAWTQTAVTIPLLASPTPEFWIRQTT